MRSSAASICDSVKLSSAEVASDTGIGGFFRMRLIWARRAASRTSASKVFERP
jgi:hypothetical protein